MSRLLESLRDRGLRAIGRTPPRPPVELDVAPLVSVGALRLVTAGLALVATLAVATEGIVLILGVIGAAMLLVLPRPIWPPMILVVLGLGLLTVDADPVRTAVLLAAGHLLVLLGALLGRMPWSGRVEVGALRRPLIRFGFVQILAQPLALVGYLLTAAGVTLAIVAVTVAILFAVVAWVLSWRLRLVRDEGHSR